MSRIRTTQACDLSIGQRIQLDHMEHEVVSIAYLPARRLVTLSLQRNEDSTAVTLRFGADAEVRVVTE